MHVVRKSDGQPGPDPSFESAVSQILKAIDGVDLPSAGIKITIEAAGSDVVGKASEETESILAKHLPVFKTAEERLVLGIVLEPTKEMGAPDTQRDVYSADEVRKSAYRFMEEYQTIGLQHRSDISDRVKILLNWIALEDTTINGQPVTAGTWLLGVRVQDDALWQDVKDGKITGFSIGGIATRTAV